MTINQCQPGVAQKASFTDIYNKQDPRAYFTTLAPLEYTIPQQVQPLFQHLYQLSSKNTDTCTVLDVCCSYGINGALLRHDVDIATWLAHYKSSDLISKQQIQVDKEFFARRGKFDKPTVLGLDKAENAIRYAKDTVLVDNAWAEDLEADNPSPDLVKALQDVSLVICTGGVGYVGAPTFSRIISAIPRTSKISVASTVIRTVSYDDIATVLQERGLITEKLPGVVLRQRRFASTEEQKSFVAQVTARGLDPAGFEKEGYLCAEIYVSRLASEMTKHPVAELVKVLEDKRQCFVLFQ